MPPPQDPFRQIDILAAQVAEEYAAFTGAGMPPLVAAVMLGTMLGVMLSTGPQQGANPA
jgi:hypothetical protein